MNEQEKTLLKEIFENNPKKYILDRMSQIGCKKSAQSIFRMARILGLKRNPEIIRQDMIEGGKSAPCPENKIEWTEQEDATLTEFYKTSSREEMVEKLPGRTWRGIRERAIRHGLSRLTGIVSKDRKKHLKEHLGIDSTWQLEKTKETSRQTNLLKRGVGYPTQSVIVRDKVKETVQNRYGVDNVFQSEEVKEKSVQTNLEKFGVKSPQQNPEIRKKTEETCVKKYGISNPFQLTDRVQSGMIKKYGVRSPLQNPYIKEKQQQTNLEKYGFETPAQNRDIQKKIEDTNLKKRGVKTPFLDPSVKQKIKETNIKKYGVSNPAKIEEIKKKIKSTTFERFGVESILQIKEIREKAYLVRKGRKNIHKSKEEIDFINYLNIFDPQTTSHVENPTTKNVIDFYMPKFDLWVQYDGAYWHGKIKRFNVTRQLLKIQRTTKRDQYQNEHISNLIRFWSDDIQEAIKNDTILDLIENKIIEKTNFSHQYLKKLETIEDDLKKLSFDPQKITPTDFSLQQEPINSEIIEFITRYEWLGTIGVIPKWCFTARYNNILGGVVCINEPTAYSKLLGNNTPVYESLIQRGATSSWAPKNLGSHLLMFSCRWVIHNTEKRLFVGYADPMANELGIIYQACNFDYLGNTFGVSHLFKHPLIKNGKWFSIQTLKRTSSFKKWCRANNIFTQNSWFKENDFKDLKAIPTEIRTKWYDWNKQIIKESEKLKVDKKHKYALVLCRDKTEEKIIVAQKNYTALPYPQKN